MTVLTMSCNFNARSAAYLRDVVMDMGIEGWRKSTRLLTTDSNPKVAKNAKVGDFTAVMHLAPATMSGKDVCPWRTEGCTAACLHTAGNPAYLEVKTRARIARTKLYFECRELFMAILEKEIVAHYKKADKLGLDPSYRLNGTSDLPWETTELIPRMMRTGLRFYDYTKSVKRAMAQPYHLTFSKSEAPDSYADSRRVLLAHGTVAVVVEGYGISAYPKPLPAMSSYFGDPFPVIDGDEHDARYYDRAGSIVALRAKGDAIGDTSGFVVSHSQFQC